MIILLHFSALLGTFDSWHSSGSYFDTLTVLQIMWSARPQMPFRKASRIEHVNLGPIPCPTRTKECAASVLRDAPCLFLKASELFWCHDRDLYSIKQFFFFFLVYACTVCVHTHWWLVMGIWQKDEHHNFKGNFSLQLMTSKGSCLSEENNFQFWGNLNLKFSNVCMPNKTTKCGSVSRYMFAVSKEMVTSITRKGKLLQGLMQIFQHQLFI